MNRKVELARMTWKEVAAVDKSPAVVLLPIGVLEQHGPAGPMGIDYILPEYLSIEAARRLEGVYVAPPVTYGHSPYFMGYSGTLSIGLETLQALLEDILEGLISHGFRNIILVNNHAGNETACEQAARAARSRHGVTLAHLYPWRLAFHLATNLYQDAKRAFGHGAEPTISVMMAVMGEDVDRAGLVADSYRPLPGFEASTPGKSRFKGFDVGLYLDAHELNQSGVSADPAEASAEKGQEIVRRMLDYFVEFIPVYRALVTEHLSRPKGEEGKGAIA